MGRPGKGRPHERRRPDPPAAGRHNNNQLARARAIVRRTLGGVDGPVTSARRRPAIGAPTRRRVDGPASESASLRFELSCRASAQVRQVAHTQTCGHLNSRLSLRESTCLQLPGKNRPSSRPPPSFSSRACQPSARAEPSQNSRQVGRNRGLALAEKPPRVIDHRQIAAQRKTFHHSITRRIQPAPIFDRAKPDRLLQASRRSRSRHVVRLSNGHAAALRGFQVAHSALGLHALYSRGHRGVRTGLRNLHDAGGNRIQIDVSANCEQRFFIEDSNALEPLLEKRTPRGGLAVG